VSLHDPEKQELQMSNEILVLLDPSLGLGTGDLKAVWDADPEAKQLGKESLRNNLNQFFTVLA
jgi:hypothetical protein